MKTENLTDEEFKQLLFAVKTDPRFHKTYRELQSENKYLGITKKNGKHTRLYILYTSMKMRCSEKNKGRNRKDYYEKGIRVCEEWKSSFLNFYIWAITNGYNDNLSIDRIDSNGNYEPANCRWVSMPEQQRNKSNNRFYTYNGKTQILAEWGREYNISYDRLFKRLKKGWTFEDALLTPINKNKVRNGKEK